MSGAPVERPRRWLFALPLILFGALATLFLGRLFAGDPSKLPSALIGRPAPVAILPALEGARLNGQQGSGQAVAGLDLATHRGKVVVVNVFASWCGPCRDEHPYLLKLAEGPAFRESRAVMAGLNYKDEPENARRFLNTLGNPYSVIGVDRSGRASIDWGVYGVPETFVIDGQGRIAHKHVGPLDAVSSERIQAKITEALAVR
ncbi:MAG: DsbE family thiol:disulfide interchange protein [Bosea sp. (in: a-proteobacteria)]